MTSKEWDRKCFLEAIDKSDWDDASLRLIYADWLEEHDEPEEADRQRKWVPASRWLREFAKKCGHTCTNYDEVWEKYSENLRVVTNREEVFEAIRVTENWGEITYEDVIKAGYDAIQHDDYFVQMGSERARDMMFDQKIKKDFWKNWEIVTGEKLNDNEKEHIVFSCSC